MIPTIPHYIPPPPPRTHLVTPEPVYITEQPIPEADRLPKMGHDLRTRIRLAAHRATQNYPGPVGQMISRELLQWEEFGAAIGEDRLVMQVVDVLLGDTT